MTHELAPAGQRAALDKIEPALVAWIDSDDFDGATPSPFAMLELEALIGYAASDPDHLACTVERLLLLVTGLVYGLTVDDTGVADSKAQREWIERVLEGARNLLDP